MFNQKGCQENRMISQRKNAYGTWEGKGKENPKTAFVGKCRFRVLQYVVSVNQRGRFQTG